MKIDRTLIGTAANPTISGGVNLYEHVRFPDNWSASTSFTAWDTGSGFDITILEGNIRTRAAIALEWGLAGPNWGGRMFVDGTVSDKEIRLEVREDDFKAGMLLGVAFSPQFALDIQVYTWHYRKWHWPSKQWSTLIDYSLDESFDLVGFLYNQIVKPWLIDGVKDLEDEIPLAFINLLVNLLSSDATPNLIASNNGIIDYVAPDGSVLSQAWDGLVMSPDLRFQWDLVDVAVSLGEVVGLVPPLTAFGEAVEVIDKLTKWCRPKVTSGPVVGVVLNVHLKISGITAFVVDGNGNTTAEVKTKNVRKDGIYMVADVDSGGDQAESVNRLGVEFTHKAGITFEAGWHTGLSWLKIFGHDFVKVFNPTDLISVAEIPVSEQYQYRLSNNVGDTTHANEKTLLKSSIFN